MHELTLRQVPTPNFELQQGQARKQACKTKRASKQAPWVWASDEETSSRRGWKLSISPREVHPDDVAEVPSRQDPADVDLAVRQKNKQANKPTNKETNKQPNRQTNKNKTRKD